MILKRCSIRFEEEESIANCVNIRHGMASISIKINGLNGKNTYSRIAYTIKKKCPEQGSSIGGKSSKATPRGHC